ncbi:MAG: hypothetical protein JKX76_14885 [Colwellia sp.]|nr:hypothetical protein [Colwellia sp.]
MATKIYRKCGVTLYITNNKRPNEQRRKEIHRPVDRELNRMTALVNPNVLSKTRRTSAM